MKTRKNISSGYRVHIRIKPVVRSLSLQPHITLFLSLRKTWANFFLHNARNPGHPSFDENVVVAAAQEDLPHGSRVPPIAAWRLCGLR
jgi:hypothetical protein